MTARSWAIALPWATPPVKPNGGHGNVYAHAKKVRLTRQTMGVLARQAGIPALHRCRVELTWFVADRIHRDEDNLVWTLKPLCDALAGTKPWDHQIVPNDTPRMDGEAHAGHHLPAGRTQGNGPNRDRDIACQLMLNGLPVDRLKPSPGPRGCQTTPAGPPTRKQLTMTEPSTTQRDDLAQILNEAVEVFYEPFDGHESNRIAARILAAGYRKPRTITDRYDDNGPDELPPLSVVLSAGKPAIMQHDGTFMDHDGSSYDTWEMTYPLTVIHEPEAEAAR